MRREAGVEPSPDISQHCHIGVLCNHHSQHRVGAVHDEQIGPDFVVDTNAFGNRVAFPGAARADQSANVSCQAFPVFHTPLASHSPVVLNKTEHFLGLLESWHQARVLRCRRRRRRQDFQFDHSVGVGDQKIGILYYMLVGSLPQGAHSLHDSQATLSRSVSRRLALLRPDNRTAPGCQDRCTREQAVRSVLMDLGD